MNILIAGGSGFIGSHLTKHYLDKGDSVYIIDNLITGNIKNIAPLQKESLHFYQADICEFDYTQLPQIDIAYQMASPASPIQYKKNPVETLMTNSYGTYRMLEHMKKGTIRSLVLASTSEIYGDPLEHPQKETYWGNVNTVGPRACYDEAKRFAEALATTYIRKFSLDIRIARIFNTYGPNMEINDGRVVSNFITQALSGKEITIYGDGNQTRSFCYVSDLVRGLTTLGEKENIKGEIINLGNPFEKTVKELASMIKTATSSTAEIVFKPIDEDDPKRRKPDITKAKNILDWEPTITLEDGLTSTIEYFKKVL